MIDAPPVLPVADPIILAQVADATLLVATAGFSDRREWTETLDRLRKVDADVIGTVLLRPDSRVHATPSYRYAPSAAPAHWWVTEASRRSESTATPASGQREAECRANADVRGDDRRSVDRRRDTRRSTIAVDEARLAERPREKPATETYPWSRSGDADDLAWLDAGDAAANGRW